MSEEKKEDAVETAAEEAAASAEATSESSEASANAQTPKQPDAQTSDGDASSQTSRPAQKSQTSSVEPPNAQTPKHPNPQTPEPDWKTLYALTLADFDNYKKRAARDREDTYRYAEADILKDVLPAVDNLQLALANAKEKADDPFVKGVQLVHDTLLKSLKDHGAEPFDSVGLDLDTERMEAIATLPHAEIPEGKVSIESKKGWMLKDKVLRAAQVVVSSGQPDGAK